MMTRLDLQLATELTQALAHAEYPKP